MAHVTELEFASLCSVTYRHRVLHVGDGRGELAEVQLGAVDERVSEVAAAAARAHARDLPLLVVSHHGGVVLPSGDALDSGDRKDFCHCFCTVGVEKSLFRPLHLADSRCSHT